jgi:chemotaxis protein MotB
MAVARSRRRGEGMNYWPGFVDALSTLLLAIIFILTFFVLGQFLLSQEVTGKDEALNRLNTQIEELSQLLALERTTGRGLRDQLAVLTDSLSKAEGEKGKLEGLLETAKADAASVTATGGQVTDLKNQVDTQKRISDQALAQVELLNQQISALRRQIAALEQALDASEARDRESQTKIADLGSRLNVALAQRVQELSRFRSDFFGRLREILGNRPDVRIVGDRFVFQSEVFFAPGQATLQPEGRSEMDKLAVALTELQAKIPTDIPWVLRVDGHTDNRPIASAQFPSNWALSASRAISVVQYLISKGIPAQRLVAAGFGEFQPIDPGDSDDARSRNRRIELKLTER